MDQVDFERLMAHFARRYYADPRSARIPVRRDRLVDLRDVRGTDATIGAVLDDFADWLKEGND